MESRRRASRERGTLATRNMDALIETQWAGRGTDRAWTVFVIARRLAAVSGLRMVDTNHLLIGSLQEGNGVALRVLKSSQTL